MTTLLDDYTKATFPLDVRFADRSQMARLFCASASRVYGVSYYLGDDGQPIWSQALDWAGDGSFGRDMGRGQYPSMDLEIAPMQREAHKDELEHTLSECALRLAENVDAPAEWRAIDEEKMAQARRELAQLNGEDLA